MSSMWICAVIFSLEVYFQRPSLATITKPARRRTAECHWGSRAGAEQRFSLFVIW